MSDDEKKKRAGVKTFLLRKLGSVRSRLQSERSKDILTFLMFVALSFLFWMMQSLGEDMNTVYRIPIKYTNIPDNTIITCELPTSVTVHLRDEGAVLMNYNLEGIPSFEVDFKQYANSRNAFILTSEEIKNLIKKNLRVYRYAGCVLYTGCGEKSQSAYRRFGNDCTAVYYQRKDTLRCRFGAGICSRVFVEYDFLCRDRFVCREGYSSDMDTDCSVA